MQQGINISNRVLIAFAGIVVVVLIGLVIWNNLRRPVPGGYIRIVNIEDFTQGRPTNRRALAEIEHALYIKVNEFIAIESNSITDMRVRDDTFEQIENDGWHRVSMVVDSESLRMSFRFFYQWGDPEQFEQYGGIIQCVPPEEVIFEDFQCRDMSSQQMPDDPLVNEIISILPHEGINFRIRANILASPPEIIVHIFVMEAMSDEATIQAIYQEALDWLEQQDIDLEQYEIVRDVNIMMAGQQ